MKMQMVVLNRESNLNIRGVLQLEYINERVEELLTVVGRVVSPEVMEEEFKPKLVEVLNTVVLDNLIRLLNYNKTFEVIEGMTNSTLGLKMSVGQSHLRMLLGERVPLDDDGFLDSDLTNIISNYLNGVYLRNKDLFDEGVSNLMDELVCNLSYYKEGLIRGGFINRDTPVVFVKVRH